MKKRNLLLILCVLVWFLAGISRLEAESRSQGAAQLEEALRRGAAACYAAEGFYPPDLSYLQEHYALEYAENQYTVHYEVFADNLMPEITVVEK